MKKFISLAIVFVMVFSLMTSAAFASPKSDVLDAMEKTVIGNHPEQMQQVRNLLAQVEINDEQAKQIIGYIEEGAAVVTEDKGNSLEDYTEAERDLAQDLFDKACDVLNLTYEVAPSKNSVHKGDITITVYDESGKLLGVLDGDTKTDAVETNAAAYIIAGAAVLVLAAAAVLVIRKRQAN